MQKVILGIITILGLGILGIFAGTTYFGAKTIHDLLGENKHLKTAIHNLSDEDQIGYAKVLQQQQAPDGSVLTTIRFVETDREDKTKKILEKDYTIKGDVIHFDALIVTFPSELVMDGKERSMYLWRRIYGEDMNPSEAFPIEDKGMEPARYSDIFSCLGNSDRATFWESIWNLSNDPEALKQHGIRAIYGNVIYKKMKPGVIYVFKINNSGQLCQEVVPDL